MQRRWWPLWRRRPCLLWERCSKRLQKWYVAEEALTSGLEMVHQKVGRIALFLQTEVLENERPGPVRQHGLPLSIVFLRHRAGPLEEFPRSGLHPCTP